MELIKTYKYKLKLTKEQTDMVCSWIGACRYVYNLALETKIEAYKKGVSLSKYDLINQLPSLKEVSWIKAVPAQTLQNSIERLDVAYQSFFKGGGFPKWAKKHKYKSILFKDVKLTQHGFKLPKLGEVKVHKDRMPSGKLKTATVIKEHNAFYVCVTFAYQSENLYPVSENQAVGIDMGLSYFLVDSNGRFVENQKHTKKYERKLKIKNRALARKKKGSNRFIRTKNELNKLHHKIANTRKDFLHKESLNLIKSNSVIVCEDLKVKNMVKFGNLSKHIFDVSWSSFFSMLEYKAASFEKEFIKVNPKYTSQKCNCCGHISSENRLSQEKFSCTNCGHQQNADLNAAKNILGEGIALKRKRDTLVCA